MNSFRQLEKIINYKFKDDSILEQALTHKSLKRKGSNEVLEFLGDRVLSLIILEKLINIYPHDDEGVLDKRFSNLVDKDACYKVALIINLTEFIQLGNTEIQSKGNRKKRILSNCCEALIGAIYKDGGYDETKKFVLTFWKDLFKNLELIPIDPKSALQEKLLKKHKKLPIYEIISKSGLDHSPTFCIEVSFKDYISTKAEASTVKEAEKLAATKFIESNKI